MAILDDLIQSMVQQQNLMQSISGSISKMEYGNQGTKRNVFTTATEDDYDFHFDFLPEHNAENILSMTYTIGTVEIQNFFLEDFLTPPSDYTTILILKKADSVSTLSDLILNAQEGYIGTPIHLMNPTLDISTYDIIHLMIFFDGFSYCCLAAGYSLSGA